MLRNFRKGVFIMSSNKTQILLKRIKEDRPWYMENFLKIRNNISYFNFRIPHIILSVFS